METFKSYGVLPPVYSTGEAGRVAEVSQQTIIRSFEEGHLQGYKIPGSRFRKIPYKSLHEMSVRDGTREPLPEKLIIIVSNVDKLRDSLEELLANTLDGVTVELSDNEFTAGYRVAENPAYKVSFQLDSDHLGESQAERLRQRINDERLGFGITVQKGPERILKHIDATHVHVRTLFGGKDEVPERWKRKEGELHFPVTTTVEHGPLVKVATM